MTVPSQRGGVPFAEVVSRPPSAPRPRSLSTPPWGGSDLTECHAAGQLSAPEPPRTPDYWIKIGGPLDGHTHWFDHPQDRLPAIARLAISPNVVRALSGEQQEAEQGHTSTAVYCLSRDERMLEYVHLASVAVEEHPIDRA